MASEQTCVIVGASLAGAEAAETLRIEGLDGRVVLIGEETERPYERPLLSKDYVHDEGFYADKDIELLTGTQVASFDPAMHELTMKNGSRMPYSRLLLSKGAAPRRLPLPGAHPHASWAPRSRSWPPRRSRSSEFWDWSPAASTATCTPSMGSTFTCPRRSRRSWEPLLHKAFERKMAR